MDLKKIKRLAFFAKFNEKFNHYKSLIDLLTLLGIRSPVFTIIGLSSHFAHALSEFLSKDYRNIIKNCEYIPTSGYIDEYILSKIECYKKFEHNDISFYEIDNYLLVYDENFYCYPSFSQEFKFNFLNLVLPKFSNFEIVSKNNKIEFTELKFNAFQSSKGDELWERIKKFVDRGIHRSILLNGPPGSGKSELSLYISEKLKEYCNGRILRISTSNVGINHNDLKLILEFFKVDIVILDDIDRFDNLNSILNLLETNKHRHKLFIATSNAGHKLPSAARRPGRFDEIHEIDSLPAEILKNNFPILEEKLNDSQKKAILKLQVAHLNELQLRFIAFGEEFNFDKEYRDLLDLCNEDRYDDDGDDDDNNEYDNEDWNTENREFESD